MKRYDPETYPDDADELRAQSNRKRHSDGPDCECRECMADDGSEDSEP